MNDFLVNNVSLMHHLLIIIIKTFFFLNLGNAKFRVEFTPNEPIPHLVSVKFNGESVPGSPYTINISVDNQNEINLASIVTNLSTLRTCSLNKGIRLILNKYAIHQTLNKISSHLPTDVTPTGYPEVIVSTPTNQKHNLELIDKKTEYEAVYMSKDIDVGPYQIHIYIDKYLINSTQPINCNLYDVSKVKVSGLDLAILGKPITFQGNYSWHFFEIFSIFLAFLKFYLIFFFSLISRCITRWRRNFRTCDYNS